MGLSQTWESPVDERLTTGVIWHAQIQCVCTHSGGWKDSRIKSPGPNRKDSPTSPWPIFILLEVLEMFPCAALTEKFFEELMKVWCFFFFKGNQSRGKGEKSPAFVCHTASEHGRFLLLNTVRLDSYCPAFQDVPEWDTRPEAGEQISGS